MLNFSRESDQVSNSSGSLHKSEIQIEEELGEGAIGRRSRDEQQVGVEVAEAAVQVAGWKIYVAWLG